MELGKAIRLARCFGHQSGRFCSVAVDHFIGYQAGIPDGLRDLRKTLEILVSGQPDAITMHAGVARTCWQPFAGRVPLIIQSIAGRPDDTADELLATPADAVKLGADAFATCAFVRGATEAAHLRRVTELVRQAEQVGMPVIVHTYPRRSVGESVEISYAPEHIAWAVRCCVECGVDVIKVPYCGDRLAYSQIVSECPVPVVAAGGPKAETLKAALAMAADVMASGAKGMTIGRNIWGAPQVAQSLSAFQMVIHDGVDPSQALAQAGLA